MRFVVFLAILCCLLMGSSACTFASSHPNGSIRTTIPHKHSTTSDQLNRKGQESIVLEDCNRNSENETVISDDDVDDEDVAIASPAKCKWAARSHIIYSFINYLRDVTIIDTHRSSYYVAAYSLGQHSQKYILQGALLI